MTLHELGFTSEQEQAYRGLVADPLTELPSDGPVVAALLGLGVVRRSAVRPSGVEVLEPASALGSLIERSEDALLASQRRVGQARTMALALAARWEAPAPRQPGIEELEDVAAVRDRLEELSFFARSSVCTVQPSCSGAPGAAAAALPLEQRSLRRGLDVRVLYPRVVVEDDSTRAWLGTSAAAGTSVRLTRYPLERMIIVDDEVAVLPRDPGAGSGGALVLRHPGALRPLLRLFAHMWTAAEELDPGPTPASAAPVAPAPDQLAVQDRRALELLAGGHTDERVAKELGVSVRHARRRVAALMLRLEAGSRFQAGAAAAHQGWI